MFTLALFAIAYHFAGDMLTNRSAGYIRLNDDEIMVSFIDVGQGDSILIRTNDNAVLIDGGEHRYRDVVMDYLRNSRVERLCYVVATHPHSDHIGGLVTVLGRMEVGRLVMPEATHNTETFLRFMDAIENNDIYVRIPEPGDNIRAGLISLTVIAPTPGPQTNLNNYSIVLRMVHGGNTFLFTGDAERESEMLMLAGGMEIHSQVLKVGHHGSRTSTTEEFLEAVNPSVAVIQVGADNIHGHPHREVMERLQARNITIFRTDQNGTIRMITDGNGIRSPYTPGS